MLFNVCQWHLHLATLSFELAAVANVLDDGGGQEGDGLGHLGSAQGAAGVGALVAGCTDQVAVGAAVHRAGGGHLKAHWATHPLFQLVLQAFQDLHLLFLLLFQLHVFFEENLILALEASFSCKTIIVEIRHADGINTFSVLIN